MNKSSLKSYAPQARKDFIAAVTARANLLGLSDRAGTLEVANAQTQGDVTVIAGQAWPAKVSGQRDQLIERIRKDGFVHTMEAVAYTWFNRFAALRYMELHDYQPRAIPRLILEKNLFGLDIDDRAAQMAGFALLMKARADDRRLFNEPIQLNVLALQESKGLDADVLTRALQLATPNYPISICMLRS